MKIEARVKVASGEIKFAVFDSDSFQGQRLLILDRGLAPNTKTVFHRIESQLLKHDTSAAIHWHFVGEPIDVSDYENLPADRRGFVFSD